MKPISHLPSQRQILVVCRRKTSPAVTIAGPQHNVVQRGSPAITIDFVFRALSRDDRLPKASKLSTAEELFDVVDEHDRVIDVMSRTEVHRRGLRHRAVHILLFRSGGEMLIHLRHADKEEFPGVWTSSASGHVSAGEPYEMSARRELFEELGVRAPLAKLGRFAACPDTSNEFTESFAAKSDAALQVDETEISAVRWLQVSAIQAELAETPENFSPAFRLIFAEYMDSHHDASDS